MQLFLRPAIGAVMLAFVPAAVLAQSAMPPASTQQTSPPAARGDAPASNAAPAETAQETAAPKGRHGHRGGRLAACRADGASLCPDVKRGERRKCLSDNASKLSPDCSAALAALPARGEGRGRRGALRNACKADIASLCSSTTSEGGEEAKGKRGRGRGIMRCLKANKEKLSPECNTAIESHRGKGRRKG